MPTCDEDERVPKLYAVYITYRTPADPDARLSLRPSAAPPPAQKTRAETAISWPGRLLSSHIAYKDA